MANIKLFNNNSDLEKALKEVESVLQKHQMTIEMNYGGLAVSFRGQIFDTIDTENFADKIHSFPRSFESERVVYSRGD